jgi:predicted AAA+ superfamily ATPase
LTEEDAPEEDWRALALRGGYPVPAHEMADAQARTLWFDGYTRTYLERDLQDLSTVTSLVDFRRLMRAACLRLGSLVNQAELGRDVGLPQPTVLRHLSLLETSYQLVRVPAYAVNRTKRLIKTPKLYWCDSGLALHLSGEAEPRGAHLENLILTDLLAWRDTQVPHPEILYWRTAAGDEVDFIVEWKGKLLPIEVKATGKPRPADARGLTQFRGEYPDLALTGLLLHTGPEVEWIAEGVLAAPWWRVI